MPTVQTPRPTVPACLSILTAITMLGLSASAHATNIVADPGFESAGGGNVYYAPTTSPFTPVSIDGGSWFVTQGAVYIDSGDPYVYEGANSVNLTGANTYAANTLSQTLSTVAGQTYTVSFFADADIPNAFALTANGTDVNGLPLTIAQNGFPNATTNSTLFTDYTGTFLATTNSTTLAFTATGSPIPLSPNYSVIIDDVSVQTAVTPEPGSLFLTVTGFLGIAAPLAKKRFGGAALVG